MIAEIFSGNRKIIESGSVYLYDLEEALTLCFAFKEKEFGVEVLQAYFENTDIQIMNLIVDGVCHYIEPLCRREDGSIGTCRPVEIASVGGKTLYMHVWSYRVSETVRKIEYTVYSADE